MFFVGLERSLPLDIKVIFALCVLFSHVCRKALLLPLSWVSHSCHDYGGSAKDHKSIPALDDLPGLRYHTCRVSIEHRTRSHRVRSSVAYLAI